MFKNTMVAIVTPMHDDGAIDYTSLEKLVSYHLENQIDGIVVLGTTGESPTVTAEERHKVVSQVVRQVSGRVPVISGVGTNATASTIATAQADEKLGIDGFLVVTPYYNKPPQEGLFQHYKKVAEAVDKPVILYNVPGRTGVDLQPVTVARLAEIDNIIGLKETVSVERIRQLRAVVPADFALYCGEDAVNLEMLQAGAQGLISVTANITPQLLHNMCQAHNVGDDALAQSIHQRLMPLHKNLFIEANPIPVKWLLAKMGLINYGIRLPLTKLAATHEAAVMAAWEAATTGD